MKITSILFTFRINTKKNNQSKILCLMEEFARVEICGILKKNFCTIPKISFKIKFNKPNLFFLKKNHFSTFKKN